MTSIRIFAHGFAGFGDKALHRLARFAAGCDAEALEYFFDATRLLVRLLQVQLKAFSQLGRFRRRRHQRERFGGLLLCVVEIAEFVNEQIVESFE